MFDLNSDDERIPFTPVALYIDYISIQYTKYLKDNYPEITPRDFTYLSTIQYYPGLTQRKLSEILFVSEANVAQIIKRLEKNGTELREPFSKHLEDGIFELRATFSSNISRVLYFFFTGRTAILTNGFIKKSNKTPIKEIEKAKKYRADYLKRKEDRR